MVKNIFNHLHPQYYTLYTSTTVCSPAEADGALQEMQGCYTCWTSSAMALCKAVVTCHNVVVWVLR